MLNLCDPAIVRGKKSLCGCGRESGGVGRREFLFLGTRDGVVQESVEVV